MTDIRKPLPRQFAKRAARLGSLCRQLGLTPLTDERAQEIFEARERRRAEIRKANDPYRGCMSVTESAKVIGIRRVILFGWLENHDWLRRSEVGWQATPEAIDAGWIVQRGPASIAWPQITPYGREEIARRFGVEDSET